MSNSNITMVAAPEGVVGEGFFATKLNDVVGLARANSLWPLPFATSCCGIEFMSVAGAKYDLSRFGAEVVRFSPRQADLLIVAGTISYKQAPILQKIYEQMCEPKWVISMGACACSGGFYDNYTTLQGIDQIIPVDEYIAGCPPRPEAVLDAIMRIQEKANDESIIKDRIKEYKGILDA